MAELIVKATKSKTISADANRSCLDCGCGFKAESIEEQFDCCPKCGSKMVVAITGYTAFGGGSKWEE